MMERKAGTTWHAPGGKGLAIPACFGRFTLDDPVCGSPSPSACLYRRRCIRYLVSCGVRGVDPAVELELVGTGVAWRIAEHAEYARIDPTPYVDPAALVSPDAVAMWSRWRGALLDVLPPTTVLVRYPHQLSGEGWWRERAEGRMRVVELGAGPEGNVWCRLIAGRKTPLWRMSLAVNNGEAVRAYPGAATLARVVAPASREHWTHWTGVPRCRVEDAGRLAGRLLADGLVKDALLTPGGRLSYHPTGESHGWRGPRKPRYSPPSRQR